MSRRAKAHTSSGCPAGDHEAWLAELYAAGWEPDVGSAGPEGSAVLIGGRQIVRHALRESVAAQAARELEQVRRKPEAPAARPVWHNRDQTSDEDWSSFEPPEQ